MGSKKNTQSVVKPKKTKNKRSQYEYPALEPSVNLITRIDEIEDMHSYSHKLNDEEKAWLNAFSEEYVCANMKHPGKKLHKSKKDKKICNDRNNARNRCIYTREKAQNKLGSIELKELAEKEEKS
jgi:hypothetical protein